MLFWNIFGAFESCPVCIHLPYLVQYLKGGGRVQSFPFDAQLLKKLFFTAQLFKSSLHSHFLKMHVNTSIIWCDKKLDLKMWDGTQLVRSWVNMDMNWVVKILDERWISIFISKKYVLSGKKDLEHWKLLSIFLFLTKNTFLAHALVLHYK